jgi:hypothetical protein
MPMDRAVDPSSALTAISYLRTRAVYDTICIVITISKTNQLQKSSQIMVLMIPPFEIMKVLWMFSSSLMSRENLKPCLTLMHDKV